MRTIKYFLLSVLWGALLTLSIDDNQHATSSTRSAHSPPLRDASHRNAGSIDDLQLDASEFFSGSKQRPKLEILAPDNGQVLEKPSVDIQLEVQGYEFPSLLHDSRVCLGLASHGERIMEQCFDQVSIRFRRRRRRSRSCKVSFCFIYFLALRHGLPLPLLPTLTPRSPYATRRLPFCSVSRSDAIPCVKSHARQFVHSARRSLRARPRPCCECAKLQGCGHQYRLLRCDRWSSGSRLASAERSTGEAVCAPANSAADGLALGW